jgi:predicted aconitase
MRCTCSIFEEGSKKVFLTKEEERMLRGEYGPGIQRSMELLVEIGEAFDAKNMILAQSAHVHGAMPLDLLSELTESVSQCRVMTTTHGNAVPDALDPEGCRRIGIPEGYDIYELVHGGPWNEIVAIFKRLGYFLTNTCIQFLVGNLPRRGDVISWGGSSGALIANSMLGACASRDSIPVNVATSVTGRVPCIGMAVKENRYARILVKVEGLDLENLSNEDYGALGFYTGGKTGIKNVVIEGLPDNLTFEQFRYLTSPMPVSGATSVCHVVGVTPEASTLNEALGGKKPEEVITIGKAQIREAMEKLTTAESNNVDLVKMGCPHCSITEIRNIVSLLGERKVHPNVRFWIATAKQVYTLAQEMGYVDTIKQAGGVFTDCCIGSADPFNFIGPKLGIVTVATNSARSANISARASGGRVRILYGTMKHCIDAAITGRWRVV